MKKMLGILIGILIGGGVVFTAFHIGKLLGSPLIETNSVTTDSRVVESIQREEKIVLLALGIQGIERKEDATKIGGFTIPGSAKVSYFQYKYDAQLGLNGKSVTVEKTGDTEYTITVPDFEFLGFNNPRFEVAVEDNGVVSFITPDIDESAAITEILNDSRKEQHIVDNAELLRMQCESFYGGIIRGIDPSLTVKFEYSGS